MTAQARGPWRYDEAKNQLIRWRGPDHPTRMPALIDVLTPRGWVRARGGLARYLWSRGRGNIGTSEAKRFAVEACSTIPILRYRRSGISSLFAGSGLRWVISPPLRMGSPARLLKSRTTIAEHAFRRRLGDHVDDAVINEALAGWQRGRERHNSIESKSQTFFQATGLTTTLLLANTALLRGQDAVTGLSAVVVVTALALASAALVLAGIYALFGAMRAYGRVAPNNTWRVIERAQESDRRLATQRYVATLLLAQRRTGLITDWKLARLKRATWCLLFGVLCIAGASAAVVAASL